MTVTVQVLNGSNSTRDAGLQAGLSGILTEGVRKNYTNELAVTTNQVASGMCFIQVTRDQVSPSEVFLVPVLVSTTVAISTSGNGYVIVRIDKNKVNDGSSNASDGSGIAVVEKVTSLPASDPYLILATISSGTITDARTWAQISENVVEDELYYDEDGQSDDSYSISITGFKGFKDGKKYVFKANTANTDAATLSVNGSAAKSIRKNVSSTLDTGDIVPGQIVEVVYDADNDWLQMQSPSGSIPTVPNKASQAEAEAGVDDAKYMTSLKTLQAIQARGGTGADGALTVTSGQTVTLFLGKIYNFSSFDVQAGGNLNFKPGVSSAAHATVSAGAVNAVFIDSAGSDYITAPNITVIGGGGSGAVVLATVSGGVITALTIKNGGTGYSSAPQLVISGGLGWDSALVNCQGNWSCAGTITLEGVVGALHQIASSKGHVLTSGSPITVLKVPNDGGTGGTGSGAGGDSDAAGSPAGQGGAPGQPGKGGNSTTGGGGGGGQNTQSGANASGYNGGNGGSGAGSATGGGGGGGGGWFTGNGGRGGDSYSADAGDGGHSGECGGVGGRGGDALSGGSGSPGAPGNGGWGYDGGGDGGNSSGSTNGGDGGNSTFGDGGDGGTSSSGHKGNGGHGYNGGSGYIGGNGSYGAAAFMCNVGGTVSFTGAIYGRGGNGGIGVIEGGDAGDGSDVFIISKGTVLARTGTVYNLAGTPGTGTTPGNSGKDGRTVIAQVVNF